jgi:BirA family biotin operon repressor/biotin-[acetyl-CoA-carboxylase] ligase
VTGTDEIDTRILTWLRAADGALSGEELARRLGCSRAAVWKRVAGLRRQGYKIEGRHADGYALAGTPDRLGPGELAPYLTGTWRDIRWQAEVDSTQRVARELARAGAAEGTTVIAERQTAGRGRLGRQWHSPAGLNLYTSIILRPTLVPSAVPQIALVVGVAVAAAVAEETGLRPAIKWPNDVLLDGYKVAGVLTEMDSEVDRVHYVVAGVGVNLNTPKSGFPPELRTKASSLMLVTGRPIDRAAFTGRLLAALEARYGLFLSEGFGKSVRTEWESYSCLTGTEVQVATPDGDRSGRVLGLDHDGALKLETADHATVRIVAGEVTVRDGYAR